jgi:hypothetical protein
MLAYPEYVIHGYDPTPVFTAAAKPAKAAMVRETATENGL